MINQDIHGLFCVVLLCCVLFVSLYNQTGKDYETKILLTSGGLYGKHCYFVNTVIMLLLWY